MVIDETQFVPELPRAIKVRVDLDPRPGRFLLTGIASPDVAERSRRAARPDGSDRTVAVLTRRDDRRTRPVHRCGVPARSRPDHSSKLRRRDCLERAVAGGFPEAVRRAPRRRAAFFDSCISTLIERDVLELASIERRGDLLKLLALLAGNAGGLLVPAKLASTSEERA